MEPENRVTQIANEIYSLHIEYARIVAKLRLIDPKEITALCSLQKVILLKSLELARACLDPKAPPVDPNLEKLY